MSWPVRIATLSKGGADALHGVQVQAARSPGRTFFRNGLRRSTALTDVATVTRATQAWGVDQGGNVAAVAAGQPVVNTAGLAVYEARTNSIRNPTFLGTSGTKGSSGATISGNVPDNMTIDGATGTVISVIGPGVEGGRPYLEVDVSGTPTTSPHMVVQFDNFAASNGQVWTSQTGVKLVSGSLANVAAVSQRIYQINSSDVTIGTKVGADHKSLISTTARYDAHEALTLDAGAGVAKIVPLYAFSGSGSAVAYRVRIYAPNSKLGADINDPPILQTNNAAATRNADVITEAVNIPVGQDFTVTATFVMPTNDAAYPNVWFLAGESTNTNRIILYASAGNAVLSLNYRAGGVGSDGTTPISAALGKPVKAVLTYSNGVIRWSANGSAVQTVNPGAFSGAFTRLFIGSNSSGNQQLNSTILDLSITMRAYSDAELRASSDITLTHDIDFVSQVYQYVGAPYVTPTDLPGTTFSRSTAAYGDDTAGNLIQFASGVPRITNKGVLVEGSATNLALQSQTFSGWSGSASGVTTNAIVAPDGTLTGAKLRSANSSVYQSLFYEPTFAAGGATITRSIYAKAGEYSWAYLQQYDGTTNRGAYFNLATGQVGNVETGVTASITPASGGWYRLSVTFSAAPGATYERVQISLAQSNGGSPIFTGDGASGFYIWGAQLEAGSFPTSYIPTTSASATCNADVLASANDPNPTAYTVVAEFMVPASGPAYGSVWTYDDGSGTNSRSFVYYDRAAGRLYAAVENGGVAQAVLNLGVATPGQTYKVAFAVAANDFAAIMTGGSVQVDGAGTVPSTSAFRIGRALFGNEFGSNIRRIQRFSVRKTNTELQALVA